MPLTVGNFTISSDWLKNRHLAGPWQELLSAVFFATFLENVFESPGSFSFRSSVVCLHQSSRVRNCNPIFCFFSQNSKLQTCIQIAFICGVQLLSRRCLQYAVLQVATVSTECYLAFDGTKAGATVVLQPSIYVE
jgi:hypothetical protein